MSRINTNVGALIAQTRLRRSQADLQDTLQRLSTGLRINRGADDPAGLIASETLRSEISGIGQAISNSERASNVIATSEGALNEAAALLVTIQELIVGAANEGAMSPDEISANQLQIDSAIESITRIANTTSFAGLKLLDGSLGYVTSGVNEAVVSDLQIHSVQFGTQPYIPVNVNVVTSAQKAELEFRNSQLTEDTTLEIRGNTGITTVALGSGTTASQIMLAVNTTSDSTGVTADYINSANPASGIIFQSDGYGSNAFASVQALESGSSFTVYDDSGATTRDEGQDAEATVNGILTKADGLNLKTQTTGLDLEMTLAETVGTGTTSFVITDGGSKFQLGPAVNTNQQVNVGIRSIAASRLGNAIVGYLSQVKSGGDYSIVSGHEHEASDIVGESIRQIAVLRGRLGAFEKNVINTNINSLQITLENVTASESQIRDADFAYETSQLTRAQILTQAGTSVLGVANQTPQTVLSLLGR